MTDLRQIERETVTNAYVAELQAENERLKDEAAINETVIDGLYANRDNAEAEIERLRAENELLRTTFKARSALVAKVEGENARLRAARAVVDEQAEDEGLWFLAETAAEAYLQQELRKLHAVIEGISPEECARRALERKE